MEALCGHVWVPSRDPKRLPVCQQCKDIYEMYRGFNRDWARPRAAGDQSGHFGAPNQRA
ncbi:MAG: DUF3039 domain-containing protein [Microthrixaceae bacterium]